MADLVSKVMEELISITACETEQDVRLVVGVEKEVATLTSNFKAIQAVLTDAEEKQWKEANINDWVDKLKDLTYEIDDVLDEWRIALLKTQIKGDEYASKLKRQVCSFINSSCFYCGKVCLRHDIAYKIKDLNKRLDVVANEKDRFKLKVLNDKEQLEQLISSSIIAESEEVDKEEEDSWSLFSQIAFFGRTSSECKDLEDIGRKIVEKCKGSPLAAKTLGSLLRFKKGRAEWQNVLDSEVWEWEVGETDIIAPLWLSYFDLSPELRRCFSYCVIFPKEHKFERHELIMHWMAQGYLRTTQGKDLEKVGEEYFDILAARSFFQDFERDEDDGRILRCKMHDIVHDFAQFLTKKEYFNVVINGFNPLRMDSFPREPRHLMLKLVNEASFPLFVQNFKKLRSLLVKRKSGNISRTILSNLFSQLCCLRELNFSDCRINEVPSTIRKLIHLRYINLSKNDFKELPETICELYNMQSLDVSWCGNLTKLPCGIEKLVNLRHLNVFSNIWRFPSNERHYVMMKGIEKLSSLKMLDVFDVIGGGQDSEAGNLGDLKILNHLQGNLMIRSLGNVTNPDDGRKAELKSKKHLSDLELDFIARIEEGMGHDEEVIEALEPPLNLESLTISYYRGITLFPSWIVSFTKLSKISLINCRNMEHLPPLGKLPSFEFLSISSMERVKKVSHKFFGIKIDDGSTSTTKDKEEMSSPSDTIIAFPKLKKLRFSMMDEWEEWDDVMLRMGDKEDKAKISIMPCLSSLYFFDCQKLKALPSYLFQLTTLEKLTILNCPILEERFQEGEGEDWPNISHIPNIEIR